MGRRILVLGGTGFVGSHLVPRIVDAGHWVVVATRRRDRAAALLPLPTVDVVEADIHDPAALARLAAGVDFVVNLVGILHESSRETFARAHVELARKVVEACRSSGVARLLHMSALNASIDGPSRYQRSKGEAEAIVQGSALDWTIFRPSVIFGRGDSFLGLFARLMRRLPIIALAAPEAKFQPVYVGDVAQAFVGSIADRRTFRARYDLCGPNVYTLRQLVEWVGETTGHVRPIIPLGPTLSKLQATVLEHLPGKLMTRDNLASMSRDNVCSGPFPEVFDLRPKSIEAIAPEYLAPQAIRSPYDAYREHGGR